ncbi:MAG: redoxin domain-containing protein [Planctomycetes bacterium]|nr:redoxin domain-containing protein [Planctomycetota bacterium]
MEELKDAPFALVGVNSDSTVERAKQAIEKNNLNWRSFQNKPAGAETQISKDWAVKGWPTVVVLDTEMKIRYRGHNGQAATEVVRELLAKPVK